MTRIRRALPPRSASSDPTDSMIRNPSRDFCNECHSGFSGHTEKPHILWSEEKHGCERLLNSSGNDTFAMMFTFFKLESRLSVSGRDDNRLAEITREVSFDSSPISSGISSNRFFDITRLSSSGRKQISLGSRSILLDETLS